MKKRVLSLFMALALCLTLLPTAALAEGAGTVSYLNFCVDAPTSVTE